jgi:hypothetical protein
MEGIVYYVSLRHTGNPLELLSGSAPGSVGSRPLQSTVSTFMRSNFPRYPCGMNTEQEPLDFLARRFRIVFVKLRTVDDPEIKPSKQLQNQVLRTE